MHFLPIISTLRRHRTAATLIVLEIALTCAIVCNAVFLINDRLARMDRASGIAEDELVNIELTGIGTKPDKYSLTEQDMVALRGIPGVKDVSVVNMIPFGGSSWNNDASITPPDDPKTQGFSAGLYMGSPSLLDTLGVRISSGRAFQPADYLTFEEVNKHDAKIASVIVTQGLADKLYPGTTAVGKPIYVWGKEPHTIVGVLEKIARPNVNKAEDQDSAVFVPINIPYTMGGNYLLRVDPSRKAEIGAAVEPLLNKLDSGRIILENRPFSEVRAKFFRQDRSMAFLLVGVCVALLIVTALGVVGLASFWVQQRTRQIGIRRALGATRGDILRYFQVENFILATCGIVLGMAMAYGMNLLLMSKYEVPRLPAEFLPIGAFLLWVLGQIAVLGPALRASMIPPAIATRTV